MTIQGLAVQASGLRCGSTEDLPVQSLHPGEGLEPLVRRHVDADLEQREINTKLARGAPVRVFLTGRRGWCGLWLRSAHW